MHTQNDPPKPARAARSDPSGSEFEASEQDEIEDDDKSDHGDTSDAPEAVKGEIKSRATRGRKVIPDTNSSDSVGEFESIVAIGAKRNRKPPKKPSAQDVATQAALSTLLLHERPRERAITSVCDCGVNAREK